MLGKGGAGGRKQGNREKGKEKGKYDERMGLLKNGGLECEKGVYGKEKKQISDLGTCGS